MTMLHRMLKNIDYNFIQVIVGLSIVLVGLFLWIDKSYFTWPPELRPLMNSKYSDIIYMILGAMLLFFAIANIEIRISKKLTLKGITLIITGGATIILLIEQFLQVLFAHNTEMTIGVILALITFALILRCAYDS